MARALPPIAWPLVAVTVVTALLAGCTTPSTGPPSCDDLEDRTASGNAPLDPALTQGPDTLAHRLAEAVGDPITSGPDQATTVTGDTPALRWTTTNGTIEHRPVDDGRFEMLRYWGHEHITPMDGSSAREDLGRMLSEVGVDLASLGPIELHREPDRLDGDIRVVWQGPELHAAGVSSNLGASFWQNTGSQAVDGYRAQVTLWPVFDLTDASVEISEDQARAVAVTGVRCQLGIDGDASESVVQMAVAADSLAVQVPVVYDQDLGCHEQKLRTVYVDAVTGSVLEISDQTAACVT